MSKQWSQWDIGCTWLNLIHYPLQKSWRGFSLLCYKSCKSCYIVLKKLILLISSHVKKPIKKIFLCSKFVYGVICPLLCVKIMLKPWASCTLWSKLCASCKLWQKSMYKFVLKKSWTLCMSCYLSCMSLCVLSWGYPVGCDIHLKHCALHRETCAFLRIWI